MNLAIEQKGYSQRGACRLVGLQAKTYRYRSRRADDSPIRERLREPAARGVGLAIDAAIPA